MLISDEPCHLKHSFFPVCTLGPSTDTAEGVSGLVGNGMDVARLNFSHAGSDYSYPEANMALVRAAAGR